ncbi:MAG: MFS transporter [Clostridium sp.]
MDIRNIELFRNKQLLALGITVMVFNLSYSVLVPIIPIFFQGVGIDTLVVGYIISAYAISKCLAQIPSGVIVDFIGDKKVLVYGLLLIGLLLTVYTVTDNPSVIILVYVLEGMVAGMAFPALYSVLSRIITKESRGQAMGSYTALSALGFGLGPLISGVVIDRFNDVNNVFYIAAIGAFVACIMVIFLIKPIKGNNINIVDKGSVKRGRGSLYIKNIVSEKLHMKIIMLGSIALLGDFIYGSMASVLPFYGVKVLGTSIGFTAYIISMNFLIFSCASPIAGIICDKIGAKKQIIISLICIVVVFFIVSFIRNRMVFAVVIGVESFAGACMFSALQSILAEYGGQSKVKGIMYGAVGTFQSIGLALGPIFSSTVFYYYEELLFVGLSGAALIVLGVFVYINVYQSKKEKLSNKMLYNTKVNM